MISNEFYLKIVRSAIKSPSGHNTQPWQFAKTEDGICIKPDFERELPVADPLHRELYISLGCVTETAMIASRFYGYIPGLHSNTMGKDSSIKISLTKDDTIEQPELFSYIKSRQTTRNLYENHSTSASEIEILKASVSKEGVDIRFFTDNNEIEQFWPFIAEANTIQMSNPLFKKELIEWIRFSEKEAMQKGDGLYTLCNGIPSMGRFLGRWIIKMFVNAKSENKRLLKQLSHSACLVIFTSNNDTPEDWINTGMAFQHFALTATKLNLCYSFLNAPCQISEIRKRMKSELQLLNEYPQLILRLGKSQKMPYSFRKNIYCSTK